MYCTPAVGRAPGRPDFGYLTHRIMKRRFERLPCPTFLAALVDEAAGTTVPLWRREP